MTFDEGLFLLLFFSPLVAFLFFFRNAWRDVELLKASLVGGLTGAAATIPVKIVAYPLINWLLGMDMRRMITSSTSYFTKVAACIGVIGPVEETVKLFGLFMVIFVMRQNERPAAIFLASIAVGIGFSLAENLDYYYLFGTNVLIIRALISSSGHALFAGIFGLAVAYAIPIAHLGGRKTLGFNFFILMTGLFCASTSHGLFNSVAFGFSPETSVPILASILIFGASLVYVFWLKVLKWDVPLIPSNWICHTCNSRRFGYERFCPRCGERVLGSISDAQYG